VISVFLSRWLELFLYPLNQSLLLWVIALVFLYRRRVRSGYYCALFATSWLYLSSTAVIANTLMELLERDYTPRAMSVVPKVDAIVLLGGAMRGDTHMGTLPDLNQQADRLIHAVALYKADKAPVLLLTGGGDPEDRPEAEQMQDLLRVMGVTPRNMLLETKSRNTHDNAVYCAQILKSRGLQRILLVTSAFHMRRAEALFLAQGLEVIAAPTDYQRLVSAGEGRGMRPSLKHLNRTTLAVHELVGYQVYRWRGWL